MTSKLNSLCFSTFDILVTYDILVKPPQPDTGLLLSLRIIAKEKSQSLLANIMISLSMMPSSGITVSSLKK